MRCRLRTCFFSFPSFVFRKNSLATLGVLLITGICSLAQQMTVAATPLQIRNGTAQRIAPMDAVQMLRVVFTLRPPHIAEEEEFLRQLQDPSSPQFHQFLSEQQWDERFAPSAEDEQKVVDWARSEGLTVSARYPNHLLVEVQAPVAVINRALNISINRYQIGAKAYFSNDRDPSLPASLQSIVHNVLGLNDIVVAHASSHGQPEPVYPVYSPGPSSAELGTITTDGDVNRFQAAQHTRNNPGLYGAYDPTDLYPSSAYNYVGLKNLGHCCNPLNHPNNSPPESSIAIVSFGDYWEGDLIGWARQFGLGMYVKRIHVGGTPPPQDSETTLDIEYSVAMANSFVSSATTAAVYSYQAANPRFSTTESALNLALTDGKARILNMSWGTPEKDLADYDGGATIDDMHAIFSQMVGEGWTLVAASGDHGATTGCQTTQVSHPASDPLVTAVGGTSISLSYGTFNFEEAWHGISCSDNDGGTGGGCSSYFSAPVYQGSAACGGNKRSVPDLALNANPDFSPQIFLWGNQWWYVGGTSVASPEMAGFFAQENAYLLYIQHLNGNTCGPHANVPCAPLGAANTDLYWAAFTGQVPHYPFYDLIHDCNDNDITQDNHQPYYCAHAGYDRTTGWGSANMMQLAWTLNFMLGGDWAGPSASFSGSPPNQWYNTDVTVNWTLADNTGSDHHPIGVAGFSAAWDSAPGDPYRETEPGNGSNYYGPQFYEASGSLNGLNNLSQGCHKIYVRAWDNGGSSSLNTYGPLCYDTIPPTAVTTISGDQQPDGNYIGPVLLSMAASDNGSGLASLGYWVDQQPLQTYSQPFYVYLPGYHFIITVTADHAGNYGYYYNYVTIDSNTQYTVSITKPGTGSGTVASSGGTINCGTTCSAAFYDEQPVTLTATPAAGSIFAGWRNCDTSLGLTCTLTVTAARNVSAVFNTPVALQFVPVTPCRVVDTRQTGGAIPGGTSRDFAIASGACPGIPSSAAAYALNLTAVPSGSLQYLTAWPTGYTRPVTSVMNSFDGRIKANAAILSPGDNHSVSIYVSNAADVVIDINGYFTAPGSGTLAFFPLTPCRVADTRDAQGPLGGPTLIANQPREFPIVQSNCGIPADAAAYSFNFTALPKDNASLAFLTAWPAGLSQPTVSTLNALTGAVTANAAIIPAGTGGDINVYPSGNDTDLIIDVNGYFAPPASHSQPLSLYTLGPCRVLDTRQTGGAFNGQQTVSIAGSGCAVPANASGYTLNATVLPSGELGYLTLWSDGQMRPEVSTLNAPDGTITSNMAIVSTTNSSIDAYAAGLTQLLLDITSYFAP